MRTTGYINLEDKSEIEVDESFLCVPSLSVIWLCIYFLVRDDFTNILVARSLKEYLKIYMWPHNLAKVTALLLALLSPIHSFYYRTNLGLINAMTIGLLWLRLILLMKAINIKLSAFIVTVNKVSFYVA